MANWKIYQSDFALRNYGYISAASTELTTINQAIDGDAETRWTPGGGTSSFIYEPGTTQYWRGFAIGNHALDASSTIYAYKYVGAAWVLQGTYGTGGSPSTITQDDFLVDFGTTVSTDKIKLTFVPANYTLIGTISLLSDRGYVNGSNVLDSGYGILEFGSGGPIYPVGRDMVSNATSIPVMGGGEITQNWGSTEFIITLNIDLIKQTDVQYSWRRIENSLRGVNVLPKNIGWSDGVWLTDDTWTNGGRAYYCSPVGTPGSQITYPGGISRASIVLKTKARGI